MLAASLAQAAGAEQLELQVSFEAKQNGDAVMLLSYLVSPINGDENLCQRLTRLAEASAALQTERLAGPELALKSAWQLARALSGGPCIESTTDRKVRVLISLPLLATSPTADENETMPPC
jgi:hypothetical protein